MIHWTLTGPQAGAPFCDIDKPAALERGERFVHYAYANLEDPDTCPKCRKAMDDACADD